jgi:hypothetical protein
MMKKGDDVVFDDDDLVRTSVSQNRVTVTMCTEESFLRTQYILLSPHIRVGKNEGAEGNRLLTTLRSLPAGFTPPG